MKVIYWGLKGKISILINGKTLLLILIVIHLQGFQFNAHWALFAHLLTIIKRSIKQIGRNWWSGFNWKTFYFTEMKNVAKLNFNSFTSFLLHICCSSDNEILINIAEKYERVLVENYFLMQLDFWWCVGAEYCSNTGQSKKTSNCFHIKYCFMIFRHCTIFHGTNK